MKTKYAPLAVVLVVVIFFAVILATFVFLSSGSVFVADSGFSSGGQKPSPVDPNACSGHTYCKFLGQELSLGGGAKCRCDRTSGNLCKCTPLAAPVDTSVKCPASPDNSPACNDKAVNSVQEYAPGRTCTCQSNGSACGCVPNQKQPIGGSCTDNSECGSGKCLDRLCVNEDVSCTSGEANCIGAGTNSCITISGGAGKIGYRCKEVSARKCSAVLDNACMPQGQDTNILSIEGPFPVNPGTTTTLPALAANVPVNCELGSVEVFPEQSQKTECTSLGGINGRVCVKQKNDEGKTVSIDWTKQCLDVKETDDTDKVPDVDALVSVGKVGQRCNRNTICGEGLICDFPEKKAGHLSIGISGQQKICVVPRLEKCDSLIRSSLCIRGTTCTAEGQSFICK